MSADIKVHEDLIVNVCTDDITNRMLSYYGATGKSVSSIILDEAHLDFPMTFPMGRLERNVLLDSIRVKDFRIQNPFRLTYGEWVLAEERITKQCEDKKARVLVILNEHDWIVIQRVQGRTHPAYGLHGYRAVSDMLGVAPVDMNAWHTYAMSWDLAGVSTYIDGVKT